LFIGGGITCGLLRQRAIDEGPGELASATFFGDKIVIVDHPIHTGARYGGQTQARLNLVDSRTGLRLARGRLDLYRTTCAPANASRMWCRSGDEIELIDVTTLAMIADKQSIAKLSSPLLAGGLYKKSAAQLDRSTGEICLKRIDGSWVAIAPNLSVSPLPEQEPGRKWDGFDALPRPAPPEDRLRLTRKERAELWRGNERLGSQSFLRGGLVEVDPPSRLGDDLLITYVDSLADSGQQFLARIARDGHVAWTAKLDTRSIVQASATDDRLILFTDSAAIAFGLEDGHRLWRYAY
jgi:hypothetical protein